ncbi:MAG: hypothetical protein RLN87_04930 [Parasphingopyxis sp.]|uniref:lipoyl protein ligase domain-containing protein n=1 Tax=Parasphingopyxis sp. TaxID=1920299 RepID=UPI0032EF5092
MLIKEVDPNRASPDYRVQAAAHFTIQSGLEFENSLWTSKTIQSGIWSCDRGLAVPASVKRLPNYKKAARSSGERGWEVAVRRSGGGCVPQGRGIYNAYLFVPNSAVTIRHAYQAFASVIEQAVASIGLLCERHSPFKTWCAGDYDLCLESRKFCGISQRRQFGTSQPKILIHAAILVDADLDQAFNAMRTFLREAGEPTSPDRRQAITVLEALGGNSRLARTFLYDLPRRLAVLHARWPDEAASNSGPS